MEKRLPTPFPVAIVGAGLIGRSWAIVFARAGHPVRLWDSDPAAGHAARSAIESALLELRRFVLLDEDPAVVLQRILPASTLEEAVAGAGYVQESTAERVDVKQLVFARIDAAAAPECILASSTSTIPASAFTADLPGRQRCLVAHPINPPHIVPLVEVAPAPWTAPGVVGRTIALHDRIGQVPILVKHEVPGFIVNRLQAALLMEAWRLVREDCCTVEDLDKCLKDGLGLRWAFMGPFETIDLNAPGGLADYARRYGPVFYDALSGTRHEPWDDALIAEVDGQRRAVLEQSQLGARAAWRDRRLMALIAHKRTMDEVEN
ncbi:MAG: 3-hydroxyacyl-CoA dehydrogenase [Acidobacteriota bacterium]